MAHLAWKAAMSVGNAHIDHQHGHIIYLVNRLADFQGDREVDKRDIYGGLSDLTLAMTRHFHDEEQLMMTNGCPWYETHAGEHVWFVEKLTEMMLMEEQVMLLRSVSFLRDWLASHLAGEDLRAAPYLREPIQHTGNPAHKPEHR